MYCFITTCSVECYWHCNDFLLVLIELFSVSVMAEALRVGQCPPNVHTEGDDPSIIFTQIDRPWMPYNFVIDSFHTKKLCSRLSSCKVPFYWENGRLAFFSPIPLWGLRGNVWYSSEGHWKARGRFHISVNWTFFARCFERMSTENQRFCSNGGRL